MGYQAKRRRAERNEERKSSLGYVLREATKHTLAALEQAREPIIPLAKKPRPLGLPTEVTPKPRKRRRRR